MIKTFPEFTKLTMAHKAEYETFIAQFPPVSEISFATIMTWWNVMGTAAAAWLNGNLVVVYYLAGDEKNSGLSLIGITKVDESMCEIFDYLKDRDEPAQLVHVSEFVVNSLEYPELFTFDEERDYHEYVIPVSSLYPLSDATNRIRTKVEKISAKIGQDNIEVKSLNLRLPENKDLLVDCSIKFWHTYTLNASPQLTQDTLETIIYESEMFEIRNICLYVHDRIQGFFLYRLTQDSECAIANYARVNANVSGVPELFIFSLAKSFAAKGIKNINFDVDLGHPAFRGYLLTVGAPDFFRKYSIGPSS